MPTIEERVAYLEGRLEDQAGMFADLRNGQTALRAAIGELQDQMNRRFEQVDRRFEQVDRRFEQVDRRSMWLFGAQLSVLLAVIAALAGAYYR